MQCERMSRASIRLLCIHAATDMHRVGDALMCFIRFDDRRELILHTFLFFCQFFRPPPPVGGRRRRGAWGDGGIDWGRNTPKRLHKAPTD